MDFPKRKQLRLPAYDYSSPGAYFVTICTQNRACILSDITVGADAPGGPILKLTSVGKIVEKYILSTDRIVGVSLDQYVIMPNHVHLILRIGSTDLSTEHGPPKASAPTSAKLPQAVGALKRLVNREIGRDIWQRGYYEHVIRSESDDREIRAYIDQNPAKWAEDRYYQEVSSFYGG